MHQLNTIAIDLAKNVFQVCTATQQMKITNNHRLGRNDLTGYMMKQQPSIVAMEACYSSHYWARTFQAMGHQVKLIPAQHVTPFVRGNKNDRNDALAIAEAAQRPHLRCVPIKSIAQQDIQSLHRIRERLISQRTRLMNQTRGLLSEYGIVFACGLTHFRMNIARLMDPASDALTPLMKEQVVMIHQEYQQLCERLEGIHQALQAIAKDNPLCQLLLSLPGIGLINATALYSAIGNASQFAHPREIPVWLGLTPRLYASGNRSITGRITKRGDRYLRKQLIHGARAALARCDKKTDKLSVWASQLKVRRGPCKAAVAYAARIARLIWLVLHRNEPYYVQAL